MLANVADAKQIFLQAVENHEPERWPEFLQDACGTDTVLRERVEALLTAYRQPNQILDNSRHQATLELRLITEEPGTVIGPYKLLQQIGEGGMGVVFMAEQAEPLQRTVALKIIKPGMDTRQVIARFEAERQAVAMMDHPNIAKVLDAGTTDSGRPYFVMELVKGVPITKYCDEKHLPLRARLELFVQVCQAVQHAHQKGIIHRDIKPNNVLVAEYDNRAVPKVIDFGVAKATAQRLTERTMFTEFGQVLGTMEYMSPEQSKFNQLDIDTRSDIYSLGVLLYELLAGSTPFEGKRLHAAAHDEMLRIIREEEPPKPSTRLSSIDTLPSVAANRHSEPARLSKDVRGELDWIVMKALEKDRNRRYETASGFAADIERHLHDEPVEAGPPSAGYRLRKFVRRNKGPVLAVALVLLALVGGVIGTSWGMVRAELARRLAEEERDEKDKARQLAETNERQALKARDAERLALQGEATQRQRAEENLKLASAALDEVFLKDAQQRLSLYTMDQAKGLPTNPEREKLERELLEKALGFYENLAHTNATDWAARRERAEAYSNIGFIQLKYRNSAQSEKAFRQAIDLMEKLVDERPEDIDQPDGRALLSSNYSILGELLQESGKLENAEEQFRKAFKISENLTAEFPTRSYYWQQYTDSLGRLSGLLAETGRTAEAIDEIDRAIKLNFSGLWVSRSQFNADLGRSDKAADDLTQAGKLTSLAESDLLAQLALMRLAAYDEAAYRQICATLVEKSLPNNPQGNQAYHIAWACVLLPNAGVDRARVVSIAEAAVAANAKDPDYLITLGAALYRAGRHEEAAKTLADAEAAYQHEQTTPSPGIYVITTITYCHLFLAMTHQRLDHHEKAETWLKKAVEEIDQLANSPRAADYPWNRRLALEVLRKEAESLITRAPTEGQKEDAAKTPR